jgi:hypothetical protein
MWKAHAGFGRTGVAHIVSESGMSPTTLVGIMVGPLGLHVALGVMLALFAAFIYVFNYTNFF